MTQGSIFFLGQDVTNKTVSAPLVLYWVDFGALGMGMLFQSPPEIEGLPLKRLVSTAFEKCDEKCVR